tara:strand:+ start:123 stop:302 length:180 start_codon:yes stop_codon:yes gene_type:complete
VIVLQPIYLLRLLADQEQHQVLYIGQQYYDPQYQQRFQEVAQMKRAQPIYQTQPFEEGS